MSLLCDPEYLKHDDTLLKTELLINNRIAGAEALKIKLWLYTFESNQVMKIVLIN